MEGKGALFSYLFLLLIKRMTMTYGQPTITAEKIEHPRMTSHAEPPSGYDSGWPDEMGESNLRFSALTWVFPVSMSPTWVSSERAGADMILSTTCDWPFSLRRKGGGYTESVA